MKSDLTAVLQWLWAYALEHNLRELFLSVNTSVEYPFVPGYVNGYYNDARVKSHIWTREQLVGASAAPRASGPVAACDSSREPEGEVT